MGIDPELNAAAADADMARVAGEACEVFASLGASVHAVRVPLGEEVVRDALTLCAVEAAAAHEATFPSREAEYGPVLAGLLKFGRSVDGMTVARIGQRRTVFRAQIAALLREVDVLLLPAMNLAAPTVAWLESRIAETESRYARIRFTAPFDLSGNPSLTLPGGMTPGGAPVAFQVVGRHLDEALLLRAGHAFQQATAWHARRPALSWR